MFKAICSECGKEVELDDKWKGFATKYPDKVKCFSCKTGKKEEEKKATAGKPYSNKYNKGVTRKSTSGSLTTPEMFMQTYQELKEAANEAGLYNEVKEFMGAWTTSIIIQKEKNGGK